MIWEAPEAAGGAEVTGEQHLYGKHALPIGEAQCDLAALIVGPDVLSGAGEVLVQEVEDLGQAGRLGRGELLRQGRQGVFAEVQIPLRNRDVGLDIQVEVKVVNEVAGQVLGLHGGRPLVEDGTGTPECSMSGWVWAVGCAEPTTRSPMAAELTPVLQDESTGIA